MVRNTNQSHIPSPTNQILVLKKSQPPLQLHQIQVAGQIEEVEEGATRAAMDETMEAGMEEDIMSLVSTLIHQVQLIVSTPSRT